MDLGLRAAFLADPLLRSLSVNSLVAWKTTEEDGRLFPKSVGFLFSSRFSENLSVYVSPP
jgi:hypothetical protein